MILYHSTEQEKRAARRQMPAAALNKNGRGAFAVAIALIALGSALPARAQTACATVTSTADDASSSSTSGTLRYAIAQTNANTCDTITITATGTITLTQGPLGISNIVPTGITISGPGAANLAISGNLASRVFQILLGVTASVSGITIENGYGAFGGGIFNGGALTVTNSTLSGNASANGGGGIYNKGALTLTKSTLSGNSAPSGGGILNYGALTVTNSTFSGNRAILYGGGIVNSDSCTLTVTNSTLSGNSANFGGGISNRGALTVTNSTLSGNASANAGGGIYNESGTLTVTNSTFSGNSGLTGGGGIYTYGGTLTVTNSTLSGNTATYAGGGIYTYGVSTLKNTLLANESSGGNCYGPIVSNGYNLSDDDSCTGSFTATSDMNNTPGGLQTDSSGNVLLQNNGGPTQTIALAYGSAAIDRIPPNACTDAAGNPLLTDQRGAARPQPTGGYCDIGAYERVQSTPFATFTPKLNIYTGAVSPAGFDLNVALTLDLSDTAIFPLTKDVTLTVGSYTVTVPANSFKVLANGSKMGSYVYSGIINGVTLSEQLSPTGTNSYSFTASATAVPATSNPVPVTLTIGTDSSTASVTARIQ